VQRRPRVGERDGRSGDVDGRDERAEDPDLVGGLVRAGAAEPGRPVGRDHDERQPRVRRLEDRRVEVGDGGAGRADHRRPGADLREAQGQEAGGALVDP